MIFRCVDSKDAIERPTRVVVAAAIDVIRDIQLELFVEASPEPASGPAMIDRRIPGMVHAVLDSICTWFCFCMKLRGRSQLAETSCLDHRVELTK